MNSKFDVVVVGAGQAGLAASYLLSLEHVPHLVLERGEIGQSWRTQRWDSFHLNTPNWCNGLAGMEFHPEAPHAFAGMKDLLAFFDDYASAFHLPIKSQTNVSSLRKTSDGWYVLRTPSGEIRAKAVILASGGLNRARLPDLAQRLSPDLAILTAGTYRNASTLPEGAVLVVGSGQSGCQIAEDLLEAGREVYLSTSKVARVPRTYRGRDILAWWKDMGILDVKLHQLENRSLQYAAQPQVSGTHGGHTLSLQSLARDGAVLVGRVRDVDRRVLALERSVAECIRFADEKSQGFKAGIDAYIDRGGLKVEAPLPDPGEPPLPDLKGSDEITHLDLSRSGISSVIWCTGFDADWSWVELDVFDQGGRPRHTDGITESPGLYFLGMPWLSSRKSGILFGASDDAAHIVEHLLAHRLSA